MHHGVARYDPKKRITMEHIQSQPYDLSQLEEILKKHDKREKSKVLETGVKRKRISKR